MEVMAFLSNLVTLISEACVNAEKLPAALISCGVVQAAAALALAIFKAPGVRSVGLADAIEGLKIEIKRIESVVVAVKGRAAGNKPLARSLARLRELMYDADDLVDELDYFRLQHQVEGGMWHCIC
ncbi:hypothetical protein EJB05_38338, partial [Eragrostis curvula]